MDDPIAKMLLPDAEFARLSLDEKFAYIQKVLRALLAEHAVEQRPSPGNPEDPS